MSSRTSTSSSIACLRLLAPGDTDLCAIGDPDQAIYGFRGADASCFERFARDYPGAKVVRLARNYRSSGTIVTASAQVIAPAAMAAIAEIVREMQSRITVHAAPTDRAEAEHVVKTIEQMIGGHSFFSIDSGRAGRAAEPNLSFADFAVLYRTDAQSAALCEAFARSGIPFKRHTHTPFGAEPAVRALLQALDEAPRRRAACRPSSAPPPNASRPATTRPTIPRWSWRGSG